MTPQNELRIVTAGSATWHTALEYYLDSMRQAWKPKALQWHKYNLNVLVTWANAAAVPLQGFQKRHLERFINDRAAHVTHTTLRAYGRTARAFIAYCAREDLVSKDCLRDYKPVRASLPRVNVPSQADVQAILRAIEKRYDPRAAGSASHLPAKERRFLKARNLCLFAGLVETGCRVGEICSLTLEDYSARNKTVTFRNTKSNEDRIIPVSDSWITIVDAWLRVRPAVTAPNLLISEFGAPLNPGCVHRIMQRLLASAGLPHHTVHSLRHYTITAIVEVNVHSAARMAGHRDLRTTMGYTHERLEAIRADHQRANPLGAVLARPERSVKSAAKPKKIF